MLSVLPVTHSAPVSWSTWPDQLEKLYEWILFSETCQAGTRLLPFAFGSTRFLAKSLFLKSSSLIVKGKDASFSLGYLHFYQDGDSTMGPWRPGLQGRLGCEEGSWWPVYECTGIFFFTPPNMGDSLARVPCPTQSISSVTPAPDQSTRPYLQASLYT